MKKYIQTILFVFILTNIYSQNNGIFLGGDDDGMAIQRVNIKSNNNIFAGSGADGNAEMSTKTPLSSAIFLGGSGHGFHAERLVQVSNHPIFAGGSDDGIAAYRKLQPSNNSIFAGSNGDGEDAQQHFDPSINKLFAGGQGDGYSTSGLSKLIWTGAISDVWHMAGNWNLHRTPTISDQAYIAKVNTHYPIIDDDLQVGALITSINSIHECRTLYIAQSAKLTGTSESWMFNVGYIEVDGHMIFYKNPEKPHRNLRATILIGPTGKVSYLK